MISDEAVEAAVRIAIHRATFDAFTHEEADVLARHVLTAAAPFIAAQARAEVLRKAARDIRESAQVIAVRSHDIGIDNSSALHAMETDAGWLELQASNNEKDLIE